MKQIVNNSDWTQVAEMKIVYRTKVKASSRPLISHSRASYELLLSVWSKDRIELQEEFKVLFLNRANRVLGVYHASAGGSCTTVADTKLIMVTALKAGASNLIVSHNHPSGNLKPSVTDRNLTDKLAAAAALLDMKLLDHIIVTTEGYYSFCDEGLI